MSLMQPLLAALSLSVAANAGLGWAWIHAREKVITAVLQRDEARAATSACSDATETLRELAEKRGAEAKKAQAVARDVASGRQKTAQTVLSTPAAVPGDACASAQVRVDAWLRGRVQP